jgi:hypothetical protein
MALNATPSAHKESRHYVLRYSDHVDFLGHLRKGSLSTGIHNHAADMLAGSGTIVSFISLPRGYARLTNSTLFGVQTFCRCQLDSHISLELA